MATITVKYHSHSTHQPFRKQYLIWKPQQPSWHVTFPYILYDVTSLSMTTPLATVRACSRRLQPRIYSIQFSSMTNTTDGIHLIPIFSNRWRYRHPPPSPFPFSHSHIYTDNKGASMPVAQRLGWGRTQCDPLLLGEALPKIHTVVLSYPHPKIYMAGHPPFPMP